MLLKSRLSSGHRLHAPRCSLPVFPVVDCLTFAIDQNLVHGLVTYYVEHPQARDELGTQGALTRVASLCQGSR